MWNENKGDHPQPNHRQVEISPSAMITNNDYSETRQLWPGVFRIEHTDEHIFIFISPIAAHVIPKRAFPNEASFQQFRVAAEHFRAVGMVPKHPPLGRASTNSGTQSTSQTNAANL